MKGSKGPMVVLEYPGGRGSVVVSYAHSSGVRGPSEGSGVLGVLFWLLSVVSQYHPCLVRPCLSV